MDLRVQNNHTQVQNTYKPRREYPGVTNNLNITIDMGGFNSNILSTPNKILSKLVIQNLKIYLKIYKMLKFYLWNSWV